jgi:hypothetical protein
MPNFMLTSSFTLSTACARAGRATSVRRAKRATPDRLARRRVHDLMEELLS